MTTGDAAIRVRDVSHQFGEPGDAQFVQALQHTSLDIVRGELLCLIGPSGCGKSTLLNMIGGLLTPTTGTVEVSGKPVRAPLPGRSVPIDTSAASSLLGFTAEHHFEITPAELP